MTIFNNNKSVQVVRLFEDWNIRVLEYQSILAKLLINSVVIVVMVVHIQQVIRQLTDTS